MLIMQIVTNMLSTVLNSDCDLQYHYVLNLVHFHDRLSQVIA